MSVCVVFVVSQFIRALFPENLEAEKRGRPSTASTKIKVRELVVRATAPPLDGSDSTDVISCSFSSSRNKRTVWSRL